MCKKKILDVTCGSRTIWFNKNHPAAIYADKRAEELYGLEIGKWSAREILHYCPRYPMRFYGSSV